MIPLALPSGFVRMTSGATKQRITSSGVCVSAPAACKQPLWPCCYQSASCLQVVRGYSVRCSALLRRLQAARPTAPHGGHNAACERGCQLCSSAGYLCSTAPLFVAPECHPPLLCPPICRMMAGLCRHAWIVAEACKAWVCRWRMRVNPAARKVAGTGGSPYKPLWASLRAQLCCWASALVWLPMHGARHVLDLQPYMGI